MLTTQETRGLSQKGAKKGYVITVSGYGVYKLHAHMVEGSSESLLDKIRASPPMTY